MALTIFGLTLSVSAIAQNEARLMRFPDINKNLITFVYAGDIWSVNASGGEARRLTSHSGLELFPKISPDGKWIAYDKEGTNGLGAVWVYNIETAQNQQLTDDSFNNGSPVFSTNGKYIYFVSDRDFNLDFSSFEFNYLFFYI